MGRWLLGILGGLVALVVAVLAVMVVGMRSKYPPVLNLVRRFARDVGNPRLLPTAGTPGANASVMHHLGRSSGKAYATPVTALPTDAGFVIALPYGRNTDWLKNVLAAGQAKLTHDGQTYAVDQPAVVPLSQVASHFKAGERRAVQLFGVTECLQLSRRPIAAP